MKIPIWYPHTKSAFAPGTSKNSYCFIYRTLTFFMWFLPTFLMMHPTLQKASFPSLGCPDQPWGLQFKRSAAISSSPSPGPWLPTACISHQGLVLGRGWWRNSCPGASWCKWQVGQGDRAVIRGSASCLAALWAWQGALEWSWWGEKVETLET